MLEVFYAYRNALKREGKVLRSSSELFKFSASLFCRILILLLFKLVNCICGVNDCIVGAAVRSDYTSILT